MEIQIQQLSKRFGEKKALNKVNLRIGEGMFGLLGPNGAGKTSLMRILTTLLPKSEGSIQMAGVPIEDKMKIRSMVGYLPQDFSVYPSFTVYEAMDYLAILSGLDDRKARKEKIRLLLAKVNLEAQMKTKVRSLSGGMKRRLGIAQAIIHDPQVLIVDEPTAGLDPEERIRFRNLLRDFSEGRIVILSTHIVEDIEFTCENLAVLKQGQLLYEGKVKGLLLQAEGHVWTAAIERQELESIREKYAIISTVSEGDSIRLRLLGSERPFSHAEAVRPTIEDAYMKLMGEA
ncbi:ABC transporter ATP-binding protein [Paenibacillus eucommiae]|uniref:ABC-2 type transport system ATP-binding protein n=1 Tax=Paenibacillus eucommiae TaxID=1355755 RepID=A0ABS4J873_9BACL|nr:ABC transporter ATP-binding protein [Paenibacillus eucommiae]MBP1996051.1 ABC-2 type transport system ATP-binding protein [Paenibacillus eucommiae]